MRLRLRICLKFSWLNRCKSLFDRFCILQWTWFPRNPLWHRTRTCTWWMDFDKSLFSIISPYKQFYSLKGAGTLKSTGPKEPEVKVEPKVITTQQKVEEIPLDDKEDTTLLPGEKEVTPVGKTLYRPQRKTCISCKRLSLKSGGILLYWTLFGVKLINKTIRRNG